jgi:hypothetical protein
MSLWARKDNIGERYKSIPSPIRRIREKRLQYQSLCLWIELTTGNIDGEWLIDYLALELGLSYPILCSILEFNIPEGREICQQHFDDFNEAMTDECVPIEKFEKSLLSRGTSNLEKFLDLDIINLTPKETAEWYLKVNFEYERVFGTNRPLMIKCISRLLKRKEDMIVRGETRECLINLKLSLMAKQTYFVDLTTAWP